jgi:hypothetical protein
VCSGNYSFKNITVPNNLSYWVINNISKGSNDSINEPVEASGWNTIRLQPIIAGG